MSDERLVFDSLVHGLFNKAYARKLSPGAIAEMRAAGIDLDRKLLPAYPLEVWERCLRIAARDIFKRSAPADFATMGERYLTVFRETLIGSALFQVARIIGPRRALLRTSKYRAVDNFTQATAREVAANVVEIRYERIGQIPQFIQGAIVGSLRAMNAEDPVVDLVEHDGEDCLFRATWKA